MESLCCLGLLLQTKRKPREWRSIHINPGWTHAVASLSCYALGGGPLALPLQDQSFLPSLAPIPMLFAGARPQLFSISLSSSLLNAHLSLSACPSPPVFKCAQHCTDFLSPDQPLSSPSLPGQASQKNRLCLVPSSFPHSPSVQQATPKGSRQPLKVTVSLRGH